MGCGSSIAQVSDSIKDGIFKPIRFLENQNENQTISTQGRIFLFGETRTQRKILEFDFISNSARQISNRIRIPVPKIQYDPLELMYEQSQEIFHLGVYGLSILPPFNKMVVLFLQKNLIFMCGGRDYDSFNIKNQSFFYSITDQQIRQISESKQPEEMQPRTQSRSKYSGNKFQKMTSMAVPRYGHIGIYLSRIKAILIFGGVGENEETIASCQKYGVMQNSWREMESMNTPRAFGQCFLFGSKVYVFGGRINSKRRSKKIQVFDPQSNHWTILNYRLHRGIQENLVFSQNPNQILIIGGRTNSGITKSVIRVNICDKTYVWDSELNLEYSAIKGLQLQNQIIIFGGQKNICQIYKQGSWTKQYFQFKKYLQVEQLQQFSYSTKSVVVKNTNNDNKNNYFENSLIAFGNDEYPCFLLLNLLNGDLTKQSVPMKLKMKSKMGIIEFSQNRYFIVGGCDQRQCSASSSSYFFNKTEKSIEESVKLCEKKYNFAICSLQNYIYIFGGHDPIENVSLKTCSKFNTQEQNWDILPTLRRARSQCTALAIGLSKIAVFGGINGNGPVIGIEIFNISSRQFDMVDPTLEIPSSILCSFLNIKNENIHIFHSNQSHFEQTVISLSNNMQEITKKQDIDKVKEPNQTEQQQKEDMQQHDKFEHLKIEDELQFPMRMIQIKPKQVKGEMIAEQNDPQLPDEKDEQFQFGKIDFQISKDLKMAEILSSHSIKNSDRESSDEEGIKMKLEAHTIMASPSKQEQSRKISTNPITWLKANTKYTIHDRLGHIFFLEQNSCIQFDKSNHTTKQIKINNISSIPLSKIK